MHITYLLFDLDNTLYPASSGFAQAIQDSMTRFVADYLNVSPEEAMALRSKHSPKHGTTLKWLQSSFNFNAVEDFFVSSHPTELHRYLQKNDKLLPMLRRIELPKSIFTNAPIEHARRVLTFFEIDEYFEHIIDIRLNKLKGKPYQSAYANALKKIQRRPQEVLFIDDLLRYLVPFQEMGGNSLLIDETGNHTPNEYGIPTIKNILELEDYLRECV